MSGPEYIEVPTKEENAEKQNESWTPFLRQCFVSSGMWTPYIATGLIMGTPTVYIPQVRREANSTDAVSFEMATWLSSAFAYSAVPSVFVIAFLAGYIGRKRTFNIVSLSMIVVAIFYTLSVTTTHMLITVIINGIAHGSAITLCIIAIVEYVSPKNRGFLLTIKSANVYWAIWLVNAIGTFAHWRYASIALIINALYSLTALFWPESPTWLASQGRFEECRKSHRWLKGCSEDAEKELDLLITSQIEDRKNFAEKSSPFRCFLNKQFYKPVLLSSLMMVLYLLSGKQVVTMYAIDILKEITNSESVAYDGMLILDGVSVFSMYVGCICSKLFKRRFLMFFFGFLTVLFLLLLSLNLYLVHLSYIPENKYISISLLVGFSVAISLGPIILASSVCAELINVKYKQQSVIIIGCETFIIQSVLLKNVAYLFNFFDMHGMFLFYGINVSVCLAILFVFLPETKDKTLQEIEMHFKKNETVEEREACLRSQRTRMSTARSRETEERRNERIEKSRIVTQSYNKRLHANASHP